MQGSVWIKGRFQGRGILEITDPHQSKSNKSYSIPRSSAHGKIWCPPVLDLSVISVSSVVNHPLR